MAELMTEQTKFTQNPLVLLHGWGLNHQVWSQLILALPTELDIHTPDLPGFGLSPCPVSYDIDSVLAQLADQIPDQSIVIGWSLGGLLAVALAGRYPHKVKKLGLIASSPCFMAKDNWPGMESRVMQQFAVQLQQDLALTVERFLAIQAMGSSTARQDIKLLKQAVLSVPLPSAFALQGGLELLASLDLRQEFAALTQSVFIILGRLDSLVPVTIAPLLQNLRPGLQLEIQQKASHAPFISHQEEFVSLLSPHILA
ncbi:MAG: pimeloyl-ACP methyl ester esterase BioH [Gammaproteobacteria bacterium]|nr:pimeloyl-ACP methyl ester esterase BioH [Gammaproteobacteria bacterium]MBU2059197.1 pimeloyl-ACP methyl ester esterase BioH [Gammaproteobacteria bacterium]MBU2173748.1 pimeloyl-ACP methyl ester esterase BioH [Gammaproteobacteria bacterium]MBU2246904.1 pimeloyl-ACP methyl ester esterase BioH [Gammaproteobacteria bacterium]MBU2343474.1 pimeloyl-ACP methyl ester esterase BioH [Gammaproteobacteria bacterium]